MLATTSVAVAQSQADIESARRQAETIQRLDQERRERELDEARRRDRPVEGLDTRTLVPKIEVAPLDAACRDIRTIAITNAPNLSWSMRGRVVAEFEGRCLGVADIERLLGEITRDYIERGYITARAYLPTQDLTTGKLEVLVAEGVVGKLRIEDSGAGSVSVGNAFPGVEGRLLNLRDLEQGIDQLNRLQSNNATLDIQPGERPGESEVVIKNAPKKTWRITPSWDNYGSRSTGKHQVGANLGFDNLFDFNDFLSLNHRESAHGTKASKDSKSDSLLYGIPFGYWYGSVSISRSTYASTITLPSGAELLSTGSNATDTYRLDRVMWRDQTTRVTLGSGVTLKSAHNFLGDQKLDVSSRNLTVLDVDLNVFTAAFGGTLGLDLGVAQGLRAFGALQDPNYLLDTSPRAQFNKLKFGGNYTLPFHVLGQDWTFTSAVVGQHARNVLYGSEQVLIGGLFTIRGFERNTLAGDDGYYARNEIAWRKAVSIAGETIAGRVYVGYDFGSVRNRVPNIAQGFLAGGAVGVGGQWRGLSFDTFIAQAISKPDSMKREPAQVWFRVGYMF